MLHEEIIINNRAVLKSYCLDNPNELYVKARPTILVYPGGGYAFCSDREAEQVALSFNAAGFNAFVMKYTTGKGYEEAYKDGVEAFRYVYNNKDKYSINKLLVCGFSAGAHMACSVATRSKEKPDGMILVYPPLIQKEWVSMCPTAIDLLDKIDSTTPKTFIVHACDDRLVPVHNTYWLMEKLDNTGVEFEAHVYRAGGHGFSVATSAIGQGDAIYQNNAKATWVGLCITWIKEGIGDIEFKERSTITVDEAPEILKTPFNKACEIEEVKRIIEEEFPGVVKDTLGTPVDGFPISGVLIYTRGANLLQLNILAEHIKPFLQ